VFAFKSAEAFRRVKIHLIYLFSLFKHFLCYYLFKLLLSGQDPDEDDEHADELP